MAFSKKLDLLDAMEAESACQPYMLNRWLSMLNPGAAQLVNETANKYHAMFADKAAYYKFMTSILPHYKKQKIHYIKKSAAG